MSPGRGETRGRSPGLANANKYHNMKNIYKLTENGWVRVRKCASFAHACRIAAELQAATGIEHCVNS